ncbi:MAG: hypothetical protein ACC608_09630 [Anaerofustis sp.]
MGYKKMTLVYIMSMMTVLIVNGIIFTWVYPTQASAFYGFAQQTIVSSVLIFTSGITIDGISKNLGSKYLETKLKKFGDSLKNDGGGSETE